MRSVVALQQALLGEGAHAIWRLSHLLHIQQSGGLLLVARNDTSQASNSVCGILIDLIAEADNYPARRTVSWGVDSQQRNHGIGTRLRKFERRTLQKRGVDLVFWDIDPLSSVELHIALNTLGGIVVGRLASDQVRVEWWIDSPRVTGVMGHGLPLPHQQIGLHEMSVLTKTTILPTGVRSLIECDERITADHVLVEIPEDLGDLEARDHEAAIQWRLRSRVLIEQLLQMSYLGVGLIHEGGRSFLLFKRGTRRSELSLGKGR
ncbi:hypothetical protein ACFLSW_05030 [Candidatus Bipolaricaulota bacterium]